MSQHDQVIANASGATVRADINAALAALFGNSSGTSEPGTTIAYQWWADTTNGLLKIRDAANASWVTVGTLASANLGLATVASPAFTGAIFLNDTANANNTKGLTVNISSVDNHAITLKDSGQVATGLSGIVGGQDVETDDFFVVEKSSGAGGGVYIKALGETAVAVPFILETWGGAPATTDTSASGAAMYFRAGQHNGSDADVDMAANSNLAGWGEIDSSGASLTRMLLKADDGELHLGNTTLVALDSEDDVQLVRAMQKESASGGIRLSELDNPFYDYKKLRKVGLAGPKDKDGFFLFPLQPRLHAHEGAMWQIHCRLAKIERKVLGVKREQSRRQVQAGRRG